jgi:AraC-like DNA-binding protein
MQAPTIALDTPPSFTGHVECRMMGRMRVARLVATGRQLLRRTAEGIARCNRPRFELLRIRSGRGLLRHHLGEVVLGRDECILLDGREPVELTLFDAEVLWIDVPADAVERHLPDPQALVCMPLGDRSPWADGLRGVVDALHASPQPSEPFLLCESLCTALALASAPIEVRSTRHVRKTFLSLQRTLSDQASTCNVTASAIARAHGISLRYLHAIYSANGTSFGRELIRFRLEHARRLLLDPAEQGHSIDDIAWQCGFSDPSHFRRRFRDFYGVPPSAMRRGGSTGSAEELPRDLRIA